MQKTWLVLLNMFILTVVDSSAIGQRSFRTTAIAAPTNKYACGFASSSPQMDMQRSTEAMTAVDSTIVNTFLYLWNISCGGRLSTIGVYKDANPLNPGYRYAAAKGSFTEQGDAVREIYYKPREVTDLLGKFRNYMLYAIALHELGHHINGDPFTTVSRDTAELDADNYAGFVFASRFRTTLDTVVTAYTAVTDEKELNGYPARSLRLNAVKAGWVKGKESANFSIIYTLVQFASRGQGMFATPVFKYYERLNRALSHALTAPAPELANKGLRNAFFRNWIKIGPCYIDDRYLYIKNNHTFYIIGKIARSNRPGYTLMIYDQYYNYLYLNKNDEIVVLEDRGRPKDIEFVIGLVRGSATDSK